MSTRYQRTPVQVPTYLRDELREVGRRIREWALNHPESAPDYLSHDTVSLAQIIEHLLRHWQKHKDRIKRHRRRPRTHGPRLLKLPSEEGRTEVP